MDADQTARTPDDEEGMSEICISPGGVGEMDADQTARSPDRRMVNHPAQ